MVLETVLLLLPCTLSNTAQISDTVFFTWYVHLCLPKPLETLLKFAFHPFFFYIFKPKGLLTWTFPSSFLLSSFFLFPHACTLLNSPLPPGLPNVSVTADHQSGGSAGHFRAPKGSRLTQRLQLDPPQTLVHGLHWCLVPGRQRDTWPNHRNTSSCRLPDAHHREKPGQRWRSSSGATTSPYAHIHL